MTPSSRGPPRYSNATRGDRPDPGCHAVDEVDIAIEWRRHPMHELRSFAGLQRDRRRFVADVAVGEQLAVEFRLRSAGDNTQDPDDDTHARSIDAGQSFTRSDWRTGAHIGCTD